MKFLSIFTLLLLAFNTRAFESEDKAKDMFNEIQRKFNNSVKFITFNFQENLISGRCYEPNSRLPLGAGLAIKTIKLDDGPMGSNDEMSLGYLSLQSSAAHFDNMNYQEYIQEATWGLREFSDTGVISLKAEGYHFDFGVDLYNDWIFALGSKDESKQTLIACYFFKNNQ